MQKNRFFRATVFVALIICLVFALFLGERGGGVANAASVDDNYSFSEIDTKIEVRRDKTYAVTETMSVYFRYGNINTGIIRDIQRVTQTTRVVDGKTVKGNNILTGLSDVKVTLDGGEAKVTEELYDNGNFYSVKMQRPSGYFDGDSTHTFVLSYIYDMSDDKVSGFDDFVLDVLGYAMNSVKTFTAKIVFPEGTDLSDTTFRTKTNKELHLKEGEFANIQDNVIDIKAFDRASGAGITVQTILPDGYFTGTSLTFFWYYIIFAAIAIAGVIGCIVLILKNTNRKPIETVEFYPPEGISVMHFASVWRIGAKNKDVAALILKWADKGMVKIEPDGKRDMIITALIPVGGTGSRKNKATGEDYFDDGAEVEYFKKLFSGIGGNCCKFSTAYYRKKAKKKDKEDLSDCVKRLKARGDGNPVKVKEETDLAKRILPFVSLVPSVAMLGYYAVLTQTWFILLFSLFWAAGTFVATEFNKTKMPLMIIFPIAFYGGVYTVLCAIFSLPVYDYAFLLYFAPAWWFVCTFILPHFIKKRTPEAQAEYGRIRGFRNFLLKAELNRIQLLFDENPDYFSDILPYCMIMNISDKVQKRFAALEIKVPEIITDGVRMGAVVWSVSRCSRAPFSSVVSSAASGWGRSGGGHGGGGHGGSHGGGGGGGGSRGC